MNGTVRALLGAAIGAVLTLLIHPTSRPFLSVVFWHSPAIDSTRPLTGAMPAVDMLGRPRTLLEASVWMQAASERMRRNMPLSRRELLDSRSVADAASKVDPDNAFWKQMTAVFLNALGDNAGSDDYLHRASQCGSWNDWQTKRLQLMQAELATRYGAWQSWQLGKVYKERSLSPVLAIEGTIRKKLDVTDTAKDSDRMERYCMIRNGNLIRKGSQSFSTGMAGANLVNLAFERPGFRPGATARSRITEREDFKESMEASGHAEEARQLRRIFDDNDSFSEFLNEKSATANLERLSLIAVVVATLPSVLLALSIMGMAIWAVGVLIPRLDSLQQALSYPAVFSVGLLLALVTYTLTLLPLAALATGLCAAFLVFSPKNERTRKFEIISPLFRFTTVFLALVFVALMSLYLVLKTPPSLQILSAMDVQTQATLGSPALIGLSVLVLALLLLMSPFWAFANRIRTSMVLSMGLRSLGALIAASCLTGSIILCPLAVYADRGLGNTLTELVTNEPVHYYLERG